MRKFTIVAIMGVVFGAVMPWAVQADDGVLLCHVNGVDNTVNTVYRVNGKGTAERDYVARHDLPYEIESDDTVRGVQVDHETFVIFSAQHFLGEAFSRAQAGSPDPNRLGGAFIHDVDMQTHADGSVSGRVVRGLLSDYVTCTLTDIPF